MTPTSRSVARMKRRIALVLVAVLAVAGLALPATAASASTTTGTIRVQLAKPNGADWHSKGFVVTASGMTKNVYKEAKTNTNGVAVFKVPQGKYTIAVATYRTKYQYAPVSQDYIKISRGQVKTIGMKMYVGGTVSGRVKSAAGKPLKNATVAATNNKGVILGSTKTDSQGKYKLRGLATGKYVIMFNERSWADPKLAVVKNYGWSFYKGDSLADAKRVMVYQQNRYAAATATSRISGKVSAGTKLSVKLTDKNNKNGRLLVDHISVKGRYLQAGSVYAPFASGRSATLKVEPGRYRLGVRYGKYSTYYYTGEGRPLTTNVNAAAVLRFGDGPLSFTFGPRR
jgi:hypothetical protein